MMKHTFWVVSDSTTLPLLYTEKINLKWTFILVSNSNGKISSIDLLKS